MKKLSFIKRINLSKISKVICLSAAIVALFAISYNVGERYYVLNSAEEPETSVFRVVPPAQADYKDEIIIYDVMHRMANSRIEAENSDKTGALKITTHQIQAVKTIVEAMNYPDKSYIIAVLARWEKGDFSVVDDEHEYFWSRLKGTIGGTD